MKIVRSWLLECCPVDLSAEDLAELLTSKGAEVERIERPWDGLDGVVVAKVLEVRDHPNSDKLCLARVSTGSSEREVVVGVRNMVPGDLVPLAGPGARVPALPAALTAREIRGVVSEGMLCSPMELGIAPTHEGILLLDDDLAPGDDLKAALGLDDAVLDICNRCQTKFARSIFGLAGCLRGPLDQYVEVFFPRQCFYNPLPHQHNILTQCQVFLMNISSRWSL
jgi:phenylalanyl-tRNA synthetase beta chain